MNFELKVIMQIGRSLPPLPHVTGIINRILKPFYLRKKREDVLVDVMGNKMILTPSECVDGGLLFYPQLYERQEIAYIKENLKQGDVFLDVGSNIGFYSLVASQKVSQQGFVVAVEADPENYRKLIRNIEINHIENIQAVNLGASDKKETLRLGINTTGNRGGNSFISESPEFVEVECLTLLDILKSTGAKSVQGAKFDIEGFEYKVLKQFFEDADSSLFPNFIITEYNPEMVKHSEGNVMELLLAQGYKIQHEFLDNKIFIKSRQHG